MPRRKPSPAPRRSAKRPAADKAPPNQDVLDAGFAKAMTGQAGPPWAVAVSGGGDSLALMHLLQGFAKARGLAAPLVLTVDHGLRKSSARDAKKVVAWAKKAGLKAHVLTWRGIKA